MECVQFPKSENDISNYIMLHQSDMKIYVKEWEHQGNCRLLEVESQLASRQDVKPEILPFQCVIPTCGELTATCLFAATAVAQDTFSGTVGRDAKYSQMQEPHEHSTPDEMQIPNLHNALTIATRSRLPPVSGEIHHTLDVPATADNHSHLYAAPSLLHFDSMRNLTQVTCARGEAAIEENPPTLWKGELQLAEILSGNITSGKSDFSLFVEKDYLIETNLEKQICAPDIEDVDEALIIGDKVLICERELSIPASIVNVESDRCKVWVTNFSRQTQLIPKEINIACLTTIERDTICSLEGEEREGSKGHKTRTRITREKLKGVLDIELTSFEKEELLNLLEEFGDIFVLKR
ncbi:hypothetical protein AVEN_255853-1 [Araneus ventricosus]|uniref:Uncharacterized protein n=1 Tax=Araneus ventricosus TaxID=182803 RepID=A0A4Y2EJU0_ARAVE|nr:hypothetical protein AVEN_255853-1 [Araneus ventricosus]